MSILFIAGSLAFGCYAFRRYQVEQATDKPDQMLNFFRRMIAGCLLPILLCPVLMWKGRERYQKYLADAKAREDQSSEEGVNNGTNNNGSDDGLDH